MTPRSRLVVALLSTALLSTVWAGPAAGASGEACGFVSDDDTPPTVGTIDISPTSIVVGKIKQSVTVSLSASDECGVSTVGTSLTYSKVGDVGSSSIYFSGFRLVSGTAQSGTWQATEVVSDYISGGAYEASEVRIHDEAYNYSSPLYPASTRLEIRGTAEFEVSAPAPARITAGSATQLSGYLDLPAREATGKLELQSLARNGTWARVGSVARAALTTYSSYSIVVRPTATTRYRLAYLGDEISAPATSPVMTVAVAPAITARAAAPTMALGRTLVVSGAVRPALPGQSVVVQRQAGSRWVSLATARIDAKGAYRAVVRMSVRGAVVLRVVKGADRDRLAGASALVRVQVR